MKIGKDILISVLALAVALFALAVVGQMAWKLNIVESRLDQGFVRLETQLAALQNQLNVTGQYVLQIGEVYETRLTEINKSISTLTKIAQLETGQVPVKYAHFTIMYEGNAYILTDSIGRKILLIPRGMDPTIASYLRAKYRPDLVVEYPIKRAVYMSSTFVGIVYRLYEETGDPRVLRSIAGIMWGKGYEWYLPEIKAMLENGTIKDVGPANSPNYEAILALKPDVIFVYLYPGPYGTEAVIQKLNQLGLPYVVVNDYAETSPLGRFEWIKFFAAFLNMTDVANTVFDKVVSKWEQLTNLVSDLDKPSVAWFCIYRGVIYPASEQVRELIRLAGGRYAYANYSNVDLEVVLAHKNIDILIWSCYGPTSVEDIIKIEPRLAELRPLIIGRAYAISKAYWQLSNAYPERLIEELISIIHPEVMPPANLTLFVHLK